MYVSISGECSCDCILRQSEQLYNKQISNQLNGRHNKNSGMP